MTSIDGMDCQGAVRGVVQSSAVPMHEHVSVLGAESERGGRNDGVGNLTWGDVAVRAPLRPTFRLDEVGAPIEPDLSHRCI
jgi:hypothetical protein